VANRRRGKPAGHKRTCRCVVCARRPRTNPRTRGHYGGRRGLVAELHLSQVETAAWRRRDYRVRDRVLDHASRLSRAHGGGTVVILSSGKRELERWRG
jgi:hypothetical protein